MIRNVRLELAEFVRARIDDYIERHGISVDTFLRQAALYYLAPEHEDSSRRRIPRFRRQAVVPPSGAVAIEANIDDAVWAELGAEAVRQGTTPELLLEHAALYYLADLDSGIVAARLIEAGEDQDADDEDSRR